MAFVDDLQLIYGDVVEPIFCILYAYLIIRIFQSRNATFRSQFYVFSMATGVCAISNVLLNYAMRIIDVRTRWLPERAVVCTLDSWLSHLFALSLTLGKILTVTTRFTSICLPIKEKTFWTPRVTYSLLTGMFLIPFLLYSYFPFQPASFATTPDGYGRYLGIAGEGFKIAKAFGTGGYVLFFITTIPMCAAAVLRLRRDRMSGSRPIRKYERTLLVYALILTATHMLKSVLQTIWFVALFLKATDLQNIIINNYMIPNTLSSFAEPLLLVFTSSKVRAELCPCLKKKVPNPSQSIRMTTVSTQQVQTSFKIST